jgi:hypothetical protein
MNLNSVMPISQVPLLVGLDGEGPQIHAVCLSPVNCLDFQVLESHTVDDLAGFQRFWEDVVLHHASYHEHAAVAVRRYMMDPHGVSAWLFDMGVELDEYPVMLTRDWLREEVAIWSLPEELAPALCLAQTALYRRFGSLISCHLWLEMLNLQEELRSTGRRLRRLMVSQLDPAPPPEYPLEVPF